MKITKEIQHELEKVRERGDLKELMVVTGIKTVAQMSRIIAAKESTTIAKIAKIKQFVEERKKQITDLESDMN